MSKQNKYSPRGIYSQFYLTDIVFK